MIRDEIKFKLENSEAFDKKQIALAIRNGNYDDNIVCSLLDEQIIVKCDSCSLRKVCEGIDKVSEELRNRTTAVVKKFEF